MNKHVVNSVGSGKAQDFIYMSLLLSRTNWVREEYLLFFFFVGSCGIVEEACVYLLCIPTIKNCQVTLISSF